MPDFENDDILNAEFLIESKPQTKRAPRRKHLPKILRENTTTKTTLREMVGVDDESLYVVEVTGASCVREIKVGSMVFIDISKKPSFEDITLLERNGKFHIHQYTGKGYVVAGFFTHAKSITAKEKD